MVTCFAEQFRFVLAFHKAVLGLAAGKQDPRLLSVLPCLSISCAFPLFGERLFVEGKIQFYFLDLSQGQSNFLGQFGIGAHNYLIAADLVQIGKVIDDDIE
jgi:hypothetical protein